MVEYPNSLPLDAAQLIVEIVRTKAVQTRQAEFAKAVWNVAGYVLQVTIGNPTVGTAGPEEGCHCGETEQAVLADVSEALQDHLNGGVMTLEGEQSAIPITVIISLVTMLLNFLHAHGWIKPGPGVADNVTAVG